MVRGKAERSGWFSRGLKCYWNVEQSGLHFILCLMNPNFYIEVGFGYTLTIALDTNEYYMDKGIEMNFIEPYPKKRYFLLCSTMITGKLSSLITIWYLSILNFTMKSGEGFRIWVEGVFE